MIFKTYQIYLGKVFASTLIKTFMVFVSLAFILNIFEEINFFKDTDASIALPIFLTFLNIPSIIFEIFPFIFLITAQFAFIKLMEQNEIIVMKNFGLDNFKIIKILSILSFFLGLLIITIYYNFSSSLKYSYLNLKNTYAKDNKYLAVITENGIWIKDQVKENINIINADKFQNNFLYEVDILQFDKDFNFTKNIISSKIFIKEKSWVLNNAIIYDSKGKIENVKNYILDTNLNFNDLNSLYSNLSSLNIFELNNLKKKYESINYSSTEIDSAIQKLISFPFYLMIMTVLASALMINIKHNKSKIFYLIFGILISVIIYYLSFFFEELGKNEQIPLGVSIWIPLIIVMLITTFSLIRINEK
tara:strand:- start:10133 stop:11215 length:1083 start_codon:yes stop_codon:yes gene_type:complete